MKKVISFSLWGDLTRYTYGAIINVQLALKYYPTWECRFYINKDDVPLPIISELSTYPNVTFIFKSSEKTLSNQLMWRLEPIDDDDVEVMICRDTDTRILPREVLAVDEWLKSGKTFHIMRDTIYHRYSIIGSLFGMRKGINIKMACLILDSNIDNEQAFLEKIIYPLTFNNRFIHDEIIKYETSECTPFPIKYDSNSHHIGEFVSSDGTRDSYYVNGLRQYLVQNIPNRIQDILTTPDYCLFFGKSTIDDFKMFLCQRVFYGRLGIITKFVIITNTMPEFISETIYDDIILFNPLPDINIDHQLSILKLCYPSIVQKEGLRACVLSSPLNIIPLNSNWISSCFGPAIMNCFHVGNNYKIYLGTVKIWRKLNSVYTLDDVYNKIKSTYSIDNTKLYHIMEKEPWILGNDDPNFGADINFIDIQYKIDLASNIGIDDNKILGTIYIIHYNKFKSREEHMRKQIKEFELEKLATNIIWINSFDREEITNDMDNDFYNYNPSIYLRPLSRVEIATTIAFYSCLDRISRNFKPCMVLEDSVVLCSDFTNQLLKIINKTPEDCNILSLGCNYTSTSGMNSYIQREFYTNIQQDTISIVSPPDRNEPLLNSFIITPTVANEIVKNNNFRKFNKHITELVKDLNGSYKIYWSKPFITSKNLFASSII